MSKKDNLENHEDKYLHITKGGFYGTLLFILGIGIIICAAILFTPGYQLEVGTRSKLGISNALAFLYNLLIGAICMFIGSSKIDNRNR